MRDSVQKKLKDVREQLSKFPPDLDTPSARLAKYHELLEFYVENCLKVRLLSSNDGKHPSMTNTLHMKFGKYIELINVYTSEIFKNEYRTKVRHAISSCVGEQLPNFLPHPVLKRLICEKLDQLWKVTDILIHDCYYSLQKVLLDQKIDEHKNDILLMKLMPAFREIVIVYLKDNNQIVHNQLQEMIRLEKHDPYTMDSLYMAKIKRFRMYLSELEVNKDREKKSKIHFEDVDDDYMVKSILDVEQATQEMLYSVYSYWKVLIRRFSDYAGLTLRAGCDFDVCSGIQDRLRRVPMEQCDFVDSYLSEDVITRTKRKQLQQTKERLEKVDAILGGHSLANIGNNSFINTPLFESSSMMTLDKLAESMNPTPTLNTTTSAPK
ncbi:hypothetical protein I4U23_020022 [Adineta vaga]|nr:hypothetical protein I4U23_020022 [Adineta vaga]